MRFQSYLTVALLAYFLLFATESSIYAGRVAKPFPAKLLSQCFQYEPTTVTLNGQIVRGTFINVSGKKEVVWLLKLNAPVCTVSGGVGSINQKAENINRLQLVLQPNDYKVFQKYLNKKVSVSGTLFYGHTQHHFTQVLLSVTAIQLKS